MRRLAASLFLIAALTIPVSAGDHPFIKPARTTNVPSVEAPKPDHKGFVVASVFYWGGVAADLATTKRGIDRGLREGNPLFARKDGTARIGANLAASAGIYAIGVLLEHKGHPKAARFFLFFAGGVRYGVAIHNAAITPSSSYP